MTAELKDPAEYGLAARQFLERKGFPMEADNATRLKRILDVFGQLPYENLSKIIKYSTASHLESVRLPDEVLEDHQAKGLGGTCFSLTYTFLSILSQAGFEAYPIMAHMHYGENTHCALVLRWKGEKYLVDPGYLLTQPLKLQGRQSTVLHTPISVVELEWHEDDGHYHLYTFMAGQRKWRYRWKDEAVDMAAFHQHWTASFHWNGMRGLCLNKVAQDRMVYVHKHFMRETSVSGKTNHNIKSNYHHEIERVFGIRADVVEQALAAIDDNMAFDQQAGLWTPVNRGET